MLETRTTHAPHVPDDAAYRGHVTDLVLRCGRGDESALAELYELFHPLVGSLAVRQVPDREVTAVVLNAFRTVWRRAGSFQPAVGGAVAWVLLELSAAVRTQAA